ncbi:MAG: leucine-rich repeat domain-containing protein, partial [Candidatus Helarchaeota archaeon]
DIEFEVRGWIPQFKNNITNLSEIIGLKNLKNLKYLYLANNQIESIKDLVELENLTHLYISNNKIKETKNINYIKEMAKRNLQFIDLSENIIAKKINLNEFNSSIKIKLNQNYSFLK